MKVLVLILVGLLCMAQAKQADVVGEVADIIEGMLKGMFKGSFPVKECIEDSQIMI